ncbi:MAG: DUF5654 family protein [Nanoarchaeota archaeon]
MEKKVNKKNNQKSKNEILAHLMGKLEAIDNEIKNDVTPAVVASFGFIIALVWRDAIKGALDYYLEKAGLTEQAYLYNFVSALIVTIVVIFIMIVVTKYGRTKKQKKIKKAVENKLEDLEEQNQEKSQK